jgi:hypothetical protein
MVNVSDFSRINPKDINSINYWGRVNLCIILRGRGMTTSETPAIIQSKFHPIFRYNTSLTPL